MVVDIAQTGMPMVEVDPAGLDHYLCVPVVYWRSWVPVEVAYWPATVEVVDLVVGVVADLHSPVNVVVATLYQGWVGLPCYY